MGGSFARMRLAPLSGMMLAALACNQGGRLQIDARWADGVVFQHARQDGLALPESIATVRVEISGPDIDSAIVQGFDISAGAASVVVDNIPAGQDREVYVLGAEEDGWVAFFGAADGIEIRPGETTKADVVLEPTPGADGSDEIVVAVEINDGVAATASRNVEVDVVAEDFEQVAFGNLPPSVADCTSLTWESLSDSPFAWQLESGDGNKTVYVVLRDAAGYCSRPILGDQIILDTTGPSIGVTGLLLADSPPGEVDQVSGAADTTEAGATVEVFADAALTSLVGSAVAGNDGSFSGIALGDNFTDEAGVGLVGNETFWARATDALGNTGNPVTFGPFITPPAYEWVSLSPTILTAGISVTAKVKALDPLASPPTITLSGYDTPPASPASFDCSTYDAGSQTYTCVWLAGGDEPEHDMSVEVTLVGDRAGNIAFDDSATLLFDYTLPTLELGPEDISIQMNPPGQEDTLTVAAGSLEPFGWLILYTARPWLDAIPSPVCGQYDEILALQADASGGIPAVSIGDNVVGNARARVLDEAGNDRCEPSCLDGCQPDCGGECCWPSCSYLCQGSVSIYDCADYVSVCNDTKPPYIDIVSAPPWKGSLEPDVTFFVRAIDGDCGSTAPAELFCRLDGGAWESCDGLVAYNGLAVGEHTAEFMARDAVGNETEPRTRDFTILSIDTLFDSDGYGHDDSRYPAPITTNSYTVDAAGNGHFFAGGPEGLFHYFETAPGQFSSERVFSDWVGLPAAMPWGDELAVLVQFPNDPAGLFTGSAGHWDLTQTNFSYGAPVSFALDSNGDLVVGYGSCDGSCSGGEEAKIAVRAPDGSWSAFNDAPATSYAYQPQITFDADGDLWLAYAHRDSNDYKIVIMEHLSSGWQPPLELADPDADFSPGPPTVSSLVVDATNQPTVLVDGTDALRPVIASYTGSAWDVQALSRDGTAGTSQGGDGHSWYGLTGAAGTQTDLIIEHFAGGSGTSQSVETGWVPRVPSVVPIADGDLASATVHFGLGWSPVGGPTNVIRMLGLGRVVLDGGTTTIEEIARSEQVKWIDVGSDPPLHYVVFQTEDFGLYGIELVEGTGWGEAELIVQAQMYRPRVAVIGNEIWVAYIDGYFQGDVVVMRRSGTWETLGAVSSTGGYAENHQLDVLASGVPVLAYGVDPGSPERIEAIWWDGASFVAPTTLLSTSGSLSGLALVGDDNGAANADGDVFVAHVSNAGTNADIGGIRFSPASENPAVAGCESCQTVLTDTANAATAYAAVDGTSGAVTVVVLPNLTNDGPLTRFRDEGGSWSETALHAEIELQDFDESAETWAPDVDHQNAFHDGSLFRDPIQLEYDSSGRLRMAFHHRDYSGGPYAYTYVEEGADGSLRAYPIWRSGNDNPDAVGLVITSNGDAHVVFPEWSTRTLHSLAESQLEIP